MGIVDLATFKVTKPSTLRGELIRRGGMMPDGFGFNGRVDRIRKYPDSTVVISIGEADDIDHIIYWSQDMWGCVE